MKVLKGVLQVGSFISKTHEYEKGFKCEEQFYESLANSRRIISTLPSLNKRQFSKLVAPPGHFWLPMHKEVPCLSQPQGQRMPTQTIFHLQTLVSVSTFSRKAHPSLAVEHVLNIC